MLPQKKREENNEVTYCFYKITIENILSRNHRKYILFLNKCLVLIESSNMEYLELTRIRLQLSLQVMLGHHPQ